MAYDADDSDEVDVDNIGVLGGLFTNIPDEYEVAGLTQDNLALLLFCQIALGFVPVVGQAMDLYDLGDCGWQIYKGVMIP